jgi:hypothetical protein
MQNENKNKNGGRELKLKAKKNDRVFNVYCEQESLIISLIFLTIEMSNFSITLFEKSIYTDTV